MVENAEFNNTMIWQWRMLNWQYFGEWLEIEIWLLKI